MIGRVCLAACILLGVADGGAMAAPPDGMTLTFAEDFRSFQAGPSGLPRWKSTLPHGNRTLPNNHEAEFYVDSTLGLNPYARVRGAFTIVATAAADDGLSPLPYRSGLISTEMSFSQYHGYFEMRARLPAGSGLWPAFWLLPAGGGWPPEIDIMEMLGQNPRKIYVSVHTRVNGASIDVTNPVATPDLSQDFHLFGVNWQADRIDWYVDGQIVESLPTPAGLDVPMFMVIDLAVGGAGSWPGAPGADTVFPARMIVDYVRVYADR